MSDIGVGSFVVCVDDKNPTNDTWLGDPLESGKVYTVREVHINPADKARGVLLVEARSRCFHPEGFEVGYLLRRFRPVNDKSIQIFRDIAEQKKVTA